MLTNPWLYEEKNYSSLHGIDYIILDNNIVKAKTKKAINSIAKSYTKEFTWSDLFTKFDDYFLLEHGTLVPQIAEQLSKHLKNVTHCDIVISKLKTKIRTMRVEPEQFWLTNPVIYTDQDIKITDYAFLKLEEKEIGKMSEKIKSRFNSFAEVLFKGANWCDWFVRFGDEYLLQNGRIAIETTEEFQTFIGKKATKYFNNWLNQSEDIENYTGIFFEKLASLEHNPLEFKLNDFKKDKQEKYLWDKLYVLADDISKFLNNEFKSYINISNKEFIKKLNKLIYTKCLWQEKIDLEKIKKGSEKKIVTLLNKQNLSTEEKACLNHYILEKNYPNYIVKSKLTNITNVSSKSKKIAGITFSTIAKSEVISKVSSFFYKTWRLMVIDNYRKYQSNFEIRQKDLSYNFINQLTNKSNTLSKYLQKEVSANNKFPDNISKLTKKELVDFLNNIIKEKQLWEEVKLDDDFLSEETIELINQKPSEGTKLIRTNRLILVDYYPNEISIVKPEQSRKTKQLLEEPFVDLSKDNFSKINMNMIFKKEEIENIVGTCLIKLFNKNPKISSIKEIQDHHHLKSYFQNHIDDIKANFNLTISQETFNKLKENKANRTITLQLPEIGLLDKSYELLILKYFKNFTKTELTQYYNIKEEIINHWIAIILETLKFRLGSEQLSYIFKNTNISKEKSKFYYKKLFNLKLKQDELTKQKKLAVNDCETKEINLEIKNIKQKQRLLNFYEEEDKLINEIAELKAESNNLELITKRKKLHNLQIVLGNLHKTLKNIIENKNTQNLDYIEAAMEDLKEVIQKHNIKIKPIAEKTVSFQWKKLKDFYKAGIKKVH